MSAFLTIFNEHYQKMHRARTVLCAVIDLTKDPNLGLGQYKYQMLE